MRDKEIKVLDKGFVCLIDSMGDDMSIVQAARVSYGQGSKGEEADRKLIGYLLDNKHWSPFEQVTMKFHVKLPIFVARQLMRHRDSFNEISAKYSELPEEYYMPERWISQDLKNKQGSLNSDVNVSIGPELYQGSSFYPEELYVNGNEISLHILYDDLIRQSFELYNAMLKKGVAREMARFVLPVATYTEFYWVVHLRSLMNFLSLRLDFHAQLEIQEYAKAVKELIKPVIPWTMEIWEQLNQK